MARWILDNPQVFAGKTVVDFATGSGLVGIAAVKLNAKANGVALSFTDANLLDAAPPEVDVICAGDVCYEKPMTDRVMTWLRQARAQGSQVFIGDPHRTYFNADGLTFLAEYQVPTTRELEDFAIKRSSVFSLD